MRAKKNRTPGPGRVTPKGTKPADHKPKLVHHPEVDKATKGSSGGADAAKHGDDRANDPHPASRRAPDRSGHRGER